MAPSGRPPRLLCPCCAISTWLRLSHLLLLRLLHHLFAFLLRIRPLLPLFSLFVFYPLRFCQPLILYPLIFRLSR